VKVVIEKKAAKYLESLDVVMKQRIEQALKDLAKEPAIETNLTAEEKKWVQEGRKHYKEHPEDFVPLTLSYVK